MIKNSLCVIVVALLCMSSESVAEFRVGVARRTITPDPLLPISGGMGPTAPAKEKKGELTVSAIVFEKETTRLAIVAIDSLGFPSVLCDRVRDKVSRIPPKNILIGASHTHSAPDCYAFPDGKGGHTGDLKHIDSMCERAAAAINEAIDNLQPASLRVATGEVQGKVAYNYYAPDLYDRRASVMQAIGRDEKVIATLVNYAVHPEVLGAGVGICSPDLIGPLRDRIEQKVGGVALFMNGALGGMITADNRDFEKPSDPQRGYWEDDRTWSECERIGNLLADESLRIIKDTPVQDNPGLVCTAKDVRIPVESETLWQVVQHSPLNYPHNDDRTVTTQINFVKLGSASILTIPGEALPNIGFFLKRKMKGEHDFLFGLTNDAFGYILTRVDFASFPRYEYISQTSLGEETGEILIKHWLEMLK